MSERDASIMDADIQLLYEQVGGVAGVFPDRLNWQVSRSAKMNCLQLYQEKHEGWWYRWRKSFPEDAEQRYWDIERGEMRNRLGELREE